MKHMAERTELEQFISHLEEKEYARGTVDKYRRDIGGFMGWLEGRELSRAEVNAWKQSVCQRYAPVTVNAKLAAVNQFLRFLGREDCRVKELRLQRRLFRRQEKELTRGEYLRLLETAISRGKHRLALLMETICATGIRVSEVRYITVEAVEQGYAEISLKGKIRTILIPAQLCRKLKKYAKKQKTASGEIFLTRNGKGMSRRQIWAEMKALCKEAGVQGSKVFPYNLRHLFARTFYNTCKDVAKLADVLGHSSIETTRIYLISTGTEHRRLLSRLGLFFQEQEWTK